MMVRQIVPATGDVELEELLERLADPANRWEPFERALLAFCDALAQSLFRDPSAAGCRSCRRWPSGCGVRPPKSSGKGLPP